MHGYYIFHYQVEYLNFGSVKYLHAQSKWTKILKNFFVCESLSTSMVSPSDKMSQIEMHKTSPNNCIQ